MYAIDGEVAGTITSLPRNGSHTIIHNFCGCLDLDPKPVVPEDIQ